MNCKVEEKIENGRADNMRALKTVCCAFALAFSLTAPASAAVVPIGNHSFEENTETVYPAPWEWMGPAQTLPSGTYGTAATPDATALVAQLSNGTGGPHPGLSDVEQTLTTLAAPNTKYTLTVDVLNANGDNALYPIKLIPLLRHADLTQLGGTAIGGTGTPASSITLLSTTWLTYSTTWTTDGTEAGVQALRLGFTVDNSQAGGTLFLDNVRLDATSTIPEPSTLALLATGLVGLLARKRR